MWERAFVGVETGNGVVKTRVTATWAPLDLLKVAKKLSLFGTTELPQIIGLF